MMSKPKLDTFDPDEYDSEHVAVTGQPELGGVVEVKYDSSAGGRYQTNDLTTVRGELLYAEDAYSTLSGDEIVFVVRDDGRERSVAFELNTDEGDHPQIRSLAPSKSKRGQRMGTVDSVTFTDERVDERSPAISTIREVIPGDTVMVDGGEYGVVTTHERGPEERPDGGEVILTTADGDEFSLKVSRYSDEVTFSERYGDELDVDTSAVQPERFRERYFDHQNEGIQTADTTDAFPAPHGADEGDRMTFTLTDEDSEDERVSGVVDEVDYFQSKRGSLSSGTGEKPPGTTVALDDGRKVVLKNIGRESRRWVTRSRREKMDDTGMVKAFVVPEDVDDDDAFRHIEDVDIQSEGAADSEYDDGDEDSEPATDGGEDVTADVEVVIPGEGCQAECYHRYKSPCTFQLNDSEMVPITIAIARGYENCKECNSLDLVRDDDEGEQKIRADGGRVDPVPRCPDCQDSHPRGEYGSEVREGEEHLTCPTCGSEWSDRTLEVETDGGQAIGPDGGDHFRPDGGVSPGGGGEHQKVKLKIIGLDGILMARALEDGQYLAVVREDSADSETLEQYRTVMDLGEFTEIEPFAVLDEDPGLVDGEDVTLDLWKPRDAMTDGGKCACGIVRCLLCGHEGHEDDGETDNYGEWYCETCVDVAPYDETPIVTDGGQPIDGTEHTHYCRDCELELALMYDEREDESVPIVCAHCGGTNTETLVADGGADTSDTGQCQKCGAKFWNQLGRLSCGDCGWTPRASRREEIRSVLSDTNQTEGGSDE